MNFSVEISDQTVSTFITHSSDQLPRLLTDHQLHREGGSLESKCLENPLSLDTCF
jgi:hypothetical protein